jgi:hypothetical protein
MAAGTWWVIAYAPAGEAVTYQYFQGTRAQAQAEAGQAVEAGGSNLSGPYATQADAQAAVAAGKAAKGNQSAAQQAGSAITSAAQNVLGLPQLSNLRDLVIRSVKVIVGALLIIIGVNSLLKNEGVSVPKPPAVIPV